MPAVWLVQIGGKFIQRSGEFFKIEPIPMKGFQGFRYKL